MECPVCEFIKSDKAKKVYEDNEVIAVLNPTPAVTGEVLVIPKKHFTIIEQVPDELAGKLFLVANKVSAALFEGLKLQGTNILLNNGVSAGQKLSHLIVHVVPRKQGDGLNFTWNPKKLNEEQMATVELKIKEFTKNLVMNEEKRAEPNNIGSKEVVIEKKQSENRKERRDMSKSGEEHEKLKEEAGEKTGQSEKEGKDNKGQAGTKEKVVDENYLIRHLRKMP